MVWINEDGVTFTDNKDDSGHIDSTLDGGIEVPSIRLKDVIEGEQIQLLKLDVEGAEFTVLEDCHAVLHLVERMIIEVHMLRPEEGRLGTLLAQLESLGFKYVLNELIHAAWMDSGNKPPFTSCPTEKYVVSVFAWQS